MVYFLSPPNTPAPFHEKYGILYFPIVADAAIYALFNSRANFTRIAESAGVAAGVAVFSIFSRRTTPLLGFLGTALYLAYKVGQYFYITRSESYLSVEGLRKSSDNVHNKVVIEYPSEIDRNDPDFEQKIKNFVESNKETVHKMCNHPAILQETINVLKQAQAILLHKFSSLQRQTAHLAWNHEARNSLMAELLWDGLKNGDTSLVRALEVFNEIYRLARGQYYYVYFPHLQNAQEPDDYYDQYYLKITEADGQAFICGPGLQRQMKIIYNETHEKLDSFLNVSLIFKDDNNVKDEEPLPGDSLYNNPDNPFRVGHGVSDPSEIDDEAN